MRLTPLLLLAITPLSLSLALAAPTPQPKSKVAPKKAPKKLTKTQVVDRLWEQSDAKFHKGDYPGAVALHRKIVALEPNDVESYSVAAWLLWSLGKRADAMQFIQKGLKANPKSSEMWDAAGQHYNLQKRRAEAENAFAKAIEVGGKSAKADLMLRRRYAHAAQNAGHLAKSIGLWRALVADFPKDVVNKNNLARVQKAARPKNEKIQSAALESPILA